MTKFKEDNKLSRGRPAGSKNKITQKSRELFMQTLEEQSIHISKAFEDLRKESPDKYLTVFAKYLSYWLPKMTEATNKIELDNSKPFNIKDVFKFDTDD